LSKAKARISTAAFPMQGTLSNWELIVPTWWDGIWTAGRKSAKNSTSSKTDL
jgi:hypothetical protein